MFKRLVPFFITFAVGLFIASFFVNISAPRFGNRARRFHEMQQLRIENDRLHDENLRLQDELDSIRRSPMSLKRFENQDWESTPDVRDPVPLPPPRPMRMGRVTVK